MTRIAVILIAAALGMAPAADSADLIGLWKVLSIQNLTTGKMEPAGRQYHSFTESHHMIVLAGQGRKKIQKSFYDMTAEEVMSQMPVGAGFYRYRREGGVLIRTNIMALSAYYEGKTFQTEFEVTSSRLVLRDSHAAADGHNREWTLVRVE